MSSSCSTITVMMIGCIISTSRTIITIIITFIILIIIIIVIIVNSFGVCSVLGGSYRIEYTHRSGNSLIFTAAN